jgi:putative ABC transport system ATP-binding protein
MDIRLINISKKYKTSEGKYIDALKGINIDINYQNFISFVGPSGSGKSTLLNIIIGLIQSSVGNVFWGKDCLSKSPDNLIAYLRRTKFGIVFQDTRFVPELTVEENILLPLVINSTSLPEKKEYYNTLLKKLNITDLRKRMPDQLSGGEKKKASIVRALINNPEILVADEPTANLDEQTVREVFNIFYNLNKLGLTVVVATHDERFAKFARETYFLKDGIVDGFSSREDDKPPKKS